MDLLTAGEVLVAGTAGLGAIGYLYKNVIRPLAKTLVLIEEATPVLTSISKEFRNNSGSTLKDHLDKVVHDTAQVRTTFGLYISATDKRLTRIEEAVTALNAAVTALSVPKPRGRRKAASSPLEVLVDEGGVPGAGP